MRRGLLAWAWVSALAFCAACSRGPASEYKQIKPVRGIIDIAFESPRQWGTYLEKSGEAEDSWKVEILHQEDRLVRMAIRKFSLNPKRKGYPVLTVTEHLESFKRLRAAVLSPVRIQRTPAIELRRFTVLGRWIETSGVPTPHVRREEAYFESKGFLYTVSYTAPAESFPTHLPLYEHLLETLRFD